MATAQSKIELLDGNIAACFVVTRGVDKVPTDLNSGLSFSNAYTQSRTDLTAVLGAGTLKSVTIVMEFTPP
jgi:hypothetical protein